MDCVSYRRRLLEDPMRNDADFLEHEQACSGCADHARRVRASEIKLRALLHVTPPPELAERIQLAASLEPPRATSRRRRLGIAAGFAMLASALTVGWFMTPAERRALTLADSVLHHIYDEAHHMREVGPVAPFQIDALFSRYGAQLSGKLGEVNFAAHCLMRKKNGVHLVLPGDIGPITVFFMPDETLSEPMVVSDARFSGYIQPTAWGSIAVVGELGERLDGLADRLLRSVHWLAGLSEHDGLLSPDHPRA
jgi:hypothetical protein